MLQINVNNVKVMFNLHHTNIFTLFEFKYVRYVTLELKNLQTAII